MRTRKKILFILSGSISAYKTLDLLRNLVKKNFEVETILTKSGSEFVSPLSISSITKRKIYQNMFSKKKIVDHMEHIQLSRNSDLIVVCPASANIIAKLANGFADDLASTTLAASNKKIFLVPSMNKKMWTNPANQENVKKLKERKINIIGPIEGNLACGEIGIGRITNIKKIEKEIEIFFKIKKIIKDKKILITAGPTFEPIDPIRYIGNFSSGKQGYEIAKAATLYGAKTILITGPTLESAPDIDILVKIQTAQDMLKQTINFCKKFKLIDVAICTAAVSDWKINQSKRKYKKNENIFKKIKFKKNADILESISNLKNFRPKIVCGFSAETNNLILNSRKKLLEKNCDLIFANKISSKFNPMGNQKNQISLIGKNREENWKKMTKGEVGEKIIKEISTYFN